MLAMRDDATLTRGLAMQKRFFQPTCGRSSRAADKLSFLRSKPIRSERDVDDSTVHEFLLALNFCSVTRWYTGLSERSFFICFLQELIVILHSPIRFDVQAA
jgi:hypothetical protein